MAATKASKRASKPARKPPKRANAKKSGGSAKARPSAKARKPAARAGSGTSQGSGVAGGVKAVGDSVGDAGQKVGQAAIGAASRAKLPLIAGGAVLAGAASGIAISAVTRSKSRKLLGLKLPRTKVKARGKDLARTADRMAAAGEQVGRISSEFRHYQGTAPNGNGARRSPIEVVLQGLTSRQ